MKRHQLGLIHRISHSLRQCKHYMEWQLSCYFTDPFFCQAHTELLSWEILHTCQTHRQNCSLHQMPLLCNLQKERKRERKGGGDLTLADAAIVAQQTRRIRKRRAWVDLSITDEPTRKPLQPELCIYKAESSFSTAIATTLHRHTSIINSLTPFLPVFVSSAGMDWPARACTTLAWLNSKLLN